MSSKFILILIFLISSIDNLKAQVDLNNGLVAFYSFSGNANDESSNNKHGQLLGGASANDTLRIKDNDIDALSLPNTVINGFTDFSISLEVKFDGLRQSDTQATSNSIVGGWSSSGGNDINFEYIKKRLHTGQIIQNLFQVKIGGELYRFSNIELSENIWYHVVLSREGNILNLFLDGVKIGTGVSANTTPIDVIQGGLIIGQEQDALGSDFQLIQGLFGKIDNLYFYNRALNSEEVNAIFNGGLTSSIDELVEIHSNIALYPNPINASNAIFIKNKSGRKITKITLTSIDGKILKQIVQDYDSSLIEVGFSGTDKPEIPLIISIEVENKFLVSKVVIRT